MVGPHASNNASTEVGLVGSPGFASVGALGACLTGLTVAFSLGHGKRGAAPPAVEGAIGAEASEVADLDDQVAAAMTLMPTLRWT